MKTTLARFLLSCAFLGAAACGRGAPSLTNDLTAPGDPLPIAPAGGLRDPSVRPAPTANPQGGIRDPSIKPAPTDPQGGVRDPSIRPSR